MGKKEIKSKVRSKISQATRLISTGQLKPSRALHLQPIEVVVFNLPLAPCGGEIQSWKRLGA